MRASGASKVPTRSRGPRTDQKTPASVSFAKPKIQKRDDCTSTVLSSGFDFKGTKINWYPGHMAKAAREITKKGLKASDILDQLLLNKARIVVLNKADLADPKVEKVVLARFASQNLPAVFVSAEHRAPVELLDVSFDVLAKRRPSGKAPPSTNLLVVGVPNVGKSTLINSLRRAKMGTAGGAKTGPLPGVTRSMSGFRVSMSPSAFLVDSPGVMLPRIDDADVALKLGLTGAVKDSLVGVYTMAQYLFFFLHDKFKRDEGYMKAFDQLLAHIATKNKLSVGAHLDLDHAAEILLRRFRSGELGRYTLDDV